MATRRRPKTRKPVAKKKASSKATKAAPTRKVARKVTKTTPKAPAKRKAALKSKTKPKAAPKAPTRSKAAPKGKAGLFGPWRDSSGRFTGEPPAIAVREIIKATAKVLTKTGFRKTNVRAKEVAQQLTIEQHRMVNRPGITRQDLQEWADDEDMVDEDGDNPFYYHDD